jgi:uncharacterized damage-inducible protein DinB
MLDLFRDLLAHKGFANAAILKAVSENPAAASDREIVELLHHVLVANRFWALAILGLRFVAEDESRHSSSFDELVQRYSATQHQESTWIAAATDADFARKLRDPLIPGGVCTVADALMQVCLHSHGHRAQCAKLLRRHGSVPPMTDFIWWLTSRPAADWPAT